MQHTIVINKGENKCDIRQKVWDYIEAKELANFPRPVHHRIPNFKTATQACKKLPILQEFQSSRVVKVNPDRPQEQARFNTLNGAHGACSKILSLEFFSKSNHVKVDPDKPLEGARLAALQAGKTLLVPTPRLQRGLFNKIVPPINATRDDLRVCSTSQGVKEFSIPVGLDSKVQVDLMVVGSVAVSEKGYRIGKGEGFADMEYAMMVSMGAVKESTVVVTVVHDCQVVDFPESIIESHDLTVDYILTPTRIIKTDCKHPKPQGIIWSKLDVEMLEKIPILKKLRAIEQKASKDVRLGASSSETEIAMRESKPEPEAEASHDSIHSLIHNPKRDSELQVTGLVVEQGKNPEGDLKFDHSPGAISTVYLGDIPAGMRVSELKGFLRERNSMPVKLTWQGAQHRAFLEYIDGHAADRALASLQGLTINGHTLQAERAKSKKAGHRLGANKAQRRTKPQKHN